VSDTGSSAADEPSAKDADAPASEKVKKRRRPSGERVKAGSKTLRIRVASVIWLIAVICALFLAVGALLIALKANQHNSVVKFVIDGADYLDGPFSRGNGVFTFNGHDAAVKSALTNWGIAAIVYLVVGKILDRIIRP
jgi:thioredoxin reductase